MSGFFPVRGGSRGAVPRLHECQILDDMILYVLYDVVVCRMHDSVSLLGALLVVTYQTGLFLIFTPVSGTNSCWSRANPRVLGNNHASAMTWLAKDETVLWNRVAVAALMMVAASAGHIVHSLGSVEQTSARMWLSSTGKWSNLISSSVGSWSKASASRWAWPSATVLYQNQVPAKSKSKC
jgi:hypothetical protein